MAQSQNEQLVLRVYASDIHTDQKEFDLLRFLSTHPVTVPQVFAYLEICPKLDIGSGCDNFSDFIGQFIQRTLTDLKNRPDKLDLTTNERLWQLFENQWHRVVKSEVRPQLVHCDFNPKNIMISKDTNPKVLGIIDWEFSDSGNGMIDLGNFFRFHYDYPNYARDSFISGYKTRHPDLDRLG